MSNTGKALRLILVFLLIPFCLSAAGIAETYKCGEAAEMLRTNAGPELWVLFGHPVQIRAA